MSVTVIVCLCGGYVGSHDKSAKTCAHLGRKKAGDRYRYVCLCEMYEPAPTDAHDARHAPIPDGVMPIYRTTEKMATTQIDGTPKEILLDRSRIKFLIFKTHVSICKVDVDHYIPDFKVEEIVNLLGAYLEERKVENARSMDKK